MILEFPSNTLLASLSNTTSCRKMLSPAYIDLREWFWNNPSNLARILHGCLQCSIDIAPQKSAYCVRARFLSNCHRDLEDYLTIIPIISCYVSRLFLAWILPCSFAADMDAPIACEALTWLLCSSCSIFETTCWTKLKNSHGVLLYTSVLVEPLENAGGDRSGANDPISDSRGFSPFSIVFTGCKAEMSF